MHNKPPVWCSTKPRSISSLITGSGANNISAVKYFGGGDFTQYSDLLSTKELGPTASVFDQMQGLSVSSESSGSSTFATSIASEGAGFFNGSPRAYSWIYSTIVITITYKIKESLTMLKFLIRTATAFIFLGRLHLFSFRLFHYWVWLFRII